MRKIRKFKLLGLIVILIGFWGCTQSGDVPEPIAKSAAVSLIPVITLINVKPDTLVEFKDSLIFTFKYTDGDGDIGNNSADSMSIYVVDTRGPFTQKYHIPPVTPSDTSLAVTGVLQVVMNNTMLIGTGTQETTTYSIKLKDRANNWSNEIISQTITIVK